MGFGTSAFGSAAFGGGTNAAPAVVVEPGPRVTSVVLTPGTAVIPGGASFQFSAQAFGENNPPQEFDWFVDIGRVDSTGRVTAPSADLVAQTGILVVRSRLNPDISDSVEFTVPAFSSIPILLEVGPDTQKNGSVLVAISQSQLLAAAETAMLGSTATAAISQLHRLAGGGAMCANQASQDRVLIRHNLRANADTSVNIAPGAPLAQVFVLTAAPAASTALCSFGDIVQGHNLIGLPSQQANTSVEGLASEQGQVLAGAPSAQINSISLSSVLVRQTLLSSSCTATAISGVGSINRIHTLSGIGSAGVVSLTTGAVKQGQVLSAPETSVTSACSSAAVTLRIALSAASSDSSNLSSVDAVTVRYALRGAATLSIGSTSAAAIVMEHTPVGTASQQGAVSGTGKATQDYVLAGSQSHQENQVEIRGIEIGASILGGAPSAQANQATGGAVWAEHRLISTYTLGGVSLSPGRITQDQALQGVGAMSAVASLGGAVKQRQILRAVGKDDQNNAAAPGHVTLEFNLSGDGSYLAGESGSGPIIITHDPGSSGTLQRNLSLGSGVLCDQLLSALSAAQKNTSPSISMAGMVTIHQPPPEQTFEFKGNAAGGVVAEYWE